MTIAVYGRSSTPSNIDALKLLVDQAKNSDLELLIDSEFQKLLKKEYPAISDLKTFSSQEDLKEKTKYLFSIGGDGTLLNTVRWIKNSDIAVVGINTGRLGFLANFLPSEMADVIKMLESGSYIEDQRVLLKVESNKDVFGEHQYALNEFTIQKEDPSAVILVKVYVNGEFLGSYYADGVILSTPTGSTGYSMSASGSIMLPGSGSFIITPIAAHNLSLRPIIVSDDAVLDFTIEGRRGGSYCTIDSKHWRIDPSMEFRVTKADCKMNIVRPLGKSYLHTLRNKLMWGVDNRNK